VERPLAKLINGFRHTQILHAAAKLGIPDLLDGGPIEIGCLVARIKADPPAVYRLLTGLRALGIVQIKDGQVHLTEMGTELSSRSSRSLKAYAILCGESWWWTGMGTLLRSIETGTSGFEHLHGVPFFEFLERSPEAARDFHAISGGGTEAQAAAQALALEGVESFVDLGAGSCATLEAFAAKLPRARLILFERPSVTRSIRALIGDSTIAGRVELVPGDLFDGGTFPLQVDVYLLKYILLDWSDEDAVRILCNVRRAMGSRSRLLVVEQILDEEALLGGTALLDLGILTLTGGRCRSAADFRKLLGAAGLEAVAIVPTTSPVSVVEARLPTRRR
jgi:hypothetical protein